ncbi:Ig-like domain-containing protein [Bacterioplanoides sp.]|uniref:Ig-like domain-containing protein n=1 Tax=Bacterioplanoides sp. TaxID=2066072 RepID=UPI003B005590
MSLHPIVQKALIAFLLLTPVSSQAAVTIVNNDAGGEGFNDTTPVTAVGGNPGTTLGQQRLNVFNKAADILNTVFDIQQPVQVNAQFNPLTCTPGSATLGQAGPASYTFIDQGGGDFILYPDALYNQLSGSDFDSSELEINATFNSTLDEGTGCLGGTSWYYGFNDNPAAGSALLPVVLHEIMHGMGFLSLLDSQGESGATFNNQQVFDIYTRQLKRQSSGVLLKDMSQSERASALISNGDLVWSGANVTARSGDFTTGINNGSVQMFAPTSYKPGSSVGHFDSALSPNEIMEPQYTEFLDDPGLATQLLVDIGWTLASPPPANSAPVITAISNQSLDEDSDTNISLSATDADGDSLSFSITSASSQLNASISGTTLTLDPIADFNGNGSVTVRVSDGSLEDSTSFNVTVNAVNDAPVFNAQSDINLVNTNTAVITLSATDIDSASNSLVYSVTSFNSAQLTTAVSGNQLTITPQTNATGSSNITVQVSDGDKTDQQTFAVNLSNPPTPPTPSNQAPVLSAISDPVLLAGDSLTINLTATDADNDSLTYGVSGSIAGIQASISGNSLTITAADNVTSNGNLTISVNDGQDSDSQIIGVTVYPAFALSDGNNQIRNGETLNAGLATADLQFSGGNNQLTLTVFFNGTQQNNLLTLSNSGYQLALPDSGAFAGIYRIDVSDSNNLTSRFFIERPLRLLTSATPLFDLGKQQLWIEGAPAGASITLDSDTGELTFRDAQNQVITDITAPDNASAFNRASVDLALTAGNLPQQITFTATSPNIPNSTLNRETLAGRNLTITVTDTRDNPLANAEIRSADNRLSDWQLPTSATTNSNGNSDFILPQENTQLAISATGFINQEVDVDAQQTQLTVTLERMISPFTLTGSITAQGFNFATERPRVTLILNDNRELNLSPTINSQNTVARFESQLDLNNTEPSSLTIRHSQASTVTQPVSTQTEELNLDVLLLALPVSTDDTLDTGSSGGGNAFLLFFVAFLTTIKRKPFTA